MRNLGVAAVLYERVGDQRYVLIAWGECATCRDCDGLLVAAVPVEKELGHDE